MLISKRKITLFAGVFAAFSFFLSLAIFPYYTRGDQKYYQAFYDAIPNYGLVDGFSYYNSALGSQEPVYFLLVYFASSIAGKSLLMSGVNASFSFLLARFILHKNVSPAFLFLLLPNFYLLVLFFSAERLKVALIFSLMGLLAYTGFRRFLFLGIALLAHAQTVLILAAELLSRLSRIRFRIARHEFVFAVLSTAVAVVLISIALFFLSDHLFAKYEAYSALRGEGGDYSGGAIAMIKPLIFALPTLYYARSKWLEAAVIHTPLIFAAILVGEERIVMFSYFAFLFYALRVKRGLNVGVMASSIYFAMKGLLFLQNVVLYGDGFSYEE